MHQETGEEHDLIEVSHESGRPGSPTHPEPPLHRHCGSLRPKYEELGGLKCYPSVLAIPGPIDLVLMAMNYKLVLPILKQCAEKGVVPSRPRREDSPEPAGA